MRTTLTIDDDVLLAVQERARRERRTSGQVLSSLARESLARQGRDESGPRAERHGFPVLPSAGTVVSNELIDRLRAEDGE